MSLSVFCSLSQIEQCKGVKTHATRVERERKTEGEVNVSHVKVSRAALANVKWPSVLLSVWKQSTPIINYSVRDTSSYSITPDIHRAAMPGLRVML